MLCASGALWVLGCVLQAMHLCFVFRSHQTSSLEGGGACSWQNQPGSYLQSCCPSYCKTTREDQHHFLWGAHCSLGCLLLSIAWGKTGSGGLQWCGCSGALGSVVLGQRLVVSWACLSRVSAEERSRHVGLHPTSSQEGPIAMRWGLSHPIHSAAPGWGFPAMQTSVLEAAVSARHFFRQLGTVSTAWVVSVYPVLGMKTVGLWREEIKRFLGLHPGLFPIARRTPM